MFYSVTSFRPRITPFTSCITPLTLYITILIIPLTFPFTSCITPLTSLLYVLCFQHSIIKPLMFCVTNLSFCITLSLTFCIKSLVNFCLRKIEWWFSDIKLISISGQIWWSWLRTHFGECYSQDVVTWYISRKYWSNSHWKSKKMVNMV